MPVDYHAWTHAPKEQGGTDPILGVSTAWVRRRFTDTVGSLSCADENDLVLTFNDGCDETSAEAQGSTDWEQFWSFPNNFQTQYLQAGRYLNQIKLRWDNGNGVDTWICFDDGPTFGENLAYFKALGELTADNYCATWARRMPVNATAQARVAQDSGSAQVVATAYWEIWYLGPYSGPNPDHNATDDPVE